MDKTLYEETYQAEESHWWFLALHELIEFFVAAHRARVPSGADFRIFDAGCGTGQLMVRLQKYGLINGIDFSDTAIDFCRQRELKNVSREDLNEWSGPDSAFDIITSLDVLYHRSIPEDRAILQKFHSALKKGGLLILNLAAFDCLKRKHDIAGQAARRYRRGALCRKLEETGFRVKIASYRLSYLFLPVFLKAFFERKNWISNKSDLESLPSPAMNSLMLQINRIENEIIKRMGLPFGVSLFVVAEKT